MYSPCFTFLLKIFPVICVDYSDRFQGSSMAIILKKYDGRICGVKLFNEWYWMQIVFNFYPTQDAAVRGATPIPSCIQC